MVRYDVAVIGLGAMGSAATAHLARRGVSVIGLERFDLMHDLEPRRAGRVSFGKAYFEDLAYVPLLERAYQLWHDLENETNRTLLDLCGVLVVGSGESDATQGVLRASERYGIDVRVMDAAQLRRVYPQIRPLDDEVGIFEPDAGIVFPEEGIAAHLDVALAHGATLTGNIRVTGWQREGGSLYVQIDGVRAFEVDRIIVCAGPWTPSTFRQLGLPITVQRNVQYWFQPLADVFSDDRFPAFFLERFGLPAPLYGFPRSR